MARKSAENHKIRAIHLHGRLNGVLVEFLQGAINANLAPTLSSAPNYHRRSYNLQTWSVNIMFGFLPKIMST